MEFCVTPKQTLNAELKRNYYYEVFRDIGKDMHGQSAGLYYTQQRDKEGEGKEGHGASEEDRGMGEEKQRPLV